MSFFFSSRRRHTRSLRDWSSDVCSSDLVEVVAVLGILVIVAPQPEHRGARPAPRYISRNPVACGNALQCRSNSRGVRVSPQQETRGGILNPHVADLLRAFSTPLPVVLLAL